MIHLAPGGRTAKLFVWCCDHLPMTVTRDYSIENLTGVRRTGAYYIARGTTLCHLFWAMLWVPMAMAAVAGGVLFFFCLMHYEIYLRNRYEFGIASLLFPEAFMLGIASLVGLVGLAIIGSEKAGLFKLLVAYLKGLKDSVCPLVSFTPPSSLP